MPLYTSSSNRLTPHERLTKHLLIGLLFGILLVGITENIIRIKGGRPDVRDTAELWSAQRQKAAKLGNKAIILLGASRIQLGTSLNVLKYATGKEPVQLAIDGSPFLEVLEDLANDPDVTGSILISATPRLLKPIQDNQRPKKWLNYYQDKFRGLWQPSVEQMLMARLQSVSALYANIIPLDRLLVMLFSGQDFPVNYLTTYPSRERDADYTLVKMPDFYINRVLRNLGKKLSQTNYNSWEEFSKAVKKLAEATRPNFNTSPNEFQRIHDALIKLKERGVKVSIINFPSSGLVKDIVDIRYPKQIWNKVTARLPATIVDYRDYPELQFELADGSHLDKTQKTEFTQRLVGILQRLDTL